jgi:hypothetical protein
MMGTMEDLSTRLAGGDYEVGSAVRATGKDEIGRFETRLRRAEPTPPFGHIGWRRSRRRRIMRASARATPRRTDEERPTLPEEAP